LLVKSHICWLLATVYLLAPAGVTGNRLHLPLDYLIKYYIYDIWLDMAGRLDG
jgi:hypothetical protein